jgi:hypothetical protein
MDPVDEVDEFRSSRSSGHLRNHSSEEDYAENINGVVIEGTGVQDLILKKVDLIETESESALIASGTRQFQILGRKLANLQIPKRGLVFEGLENENESTTQTYPSFQMESLTSSGEETEEAIVSELDRTISKKNFDDDNDIEIIPEESILKRINSHKETKSYQLGKQLSFKWTTGAGPRIGCVRDYPCELQFRALEQVNLSPRSGSRTKSSFTLRSTSSLNSNSYLSSLSGETETEPLLVENKSMSQRSESSPLMRGTSVIPVIHMTHE